MTTTQRTSPEQVLRWWQLRYGALTPDLQSGSCNGERWPTYRTCHRRPSGERSTPPPSSRTPSRLLESSRRATSRRHGNSSLGGEPRASVGQVESLPPSRRQAVGPGALRRSTCHRSSKRWIARSSAMGCLRRRGQPTAPGSSTTRGALRPAMGTDAHRVRRSYRMEYRMTAEGTACVPELPESVPTALRAGGVSRRGRAALVCRLDSGSVLGTTHRCNSSMGAPPRRAGPRRELDGVLNPPTVSRRLRRDHPRGPIVWQDCIVTVESIGG